MRGLYLHIPFCRSKCPYCDFNSYVGKEELMNEYVAALLEHIRQSKEQNSGKIDTVFIGGGTPTALPTPLLEQLLCRLRRLFPQSLSEFTVEANPNSIDSEKLKVFREYGVSRISVGLQAWQNHLLKRIGRTHTVSDFSDSLELISRIGIPSVNVDVMYGLPGQTMADWRETLEELIRLNLPHLSCYSLTIAEHTPFAQRSPDALPDEDTEREMNHLAKELLSQSGMIRYEISNFAKPGQECKHNMIYWKGGEYAAFGAGASGFLNGVRFTWEPNPERYIRQVQSGAIRPSVSETVTDPVGEAIILRLRLAEGVSYRDMEQTFGPNWSKPYETVIEQHTKNGLLTKTEKNFALTDRGFDLANYVMSDFI